MDQNTKDVLVLLIPTAASVFTGYIAMRAKSKVEEVAKVVDRVEQATNGRTSELIEADRRAAHLEGKQEEREERRARDVNRTDVSGQ